MEHFVEWKPLLGNLLFLLDDIQRAVFLSNSNAGANFLLVLEFYEEG
jgi:hypothetical protein